MRRVLSLTFLLLCMTAIVGFYGQGHTARAQAVQKQEVTQTTVASQEYLYYTLKESKGFVLARAAKGSDGQPIGNPQPLALIGNSFGISPNDNVLALEASPDSRFVVIDGTRGDTEQVWAYDTQNSTVRMMPADVTGNFLRWLPKGHSFLYRPMLPMGPAAMTDGNVWNPGLWIVDAATGTHQNITIGVPAAYLVDAAPSPTGNEIVYSISAGLGMGSETWMINSNGSNAKRLFTGSQAIAALFSWSPDGTTIAYQRLADSTTPFLSAGLWTMNAQGEKQQHLADSDGGHGYTLSWSPDSRKIAYVARTNSDDKQANFSAQLATTAIAIADVKSKSTQIIASTKQTGMQLNVNPAWSTDSKQITFTAMNAVNRVVGGTPRYWSASVTEHKQNAQPVSGTIQHVIAMQ